MKKSEMVKLFDESVNDFLSSQECEAVFMVYGVKRAKRLTARAKRKYPHLYFNHVGTVASIASPYTGQDVIYMRREN